MKWQIGDRVETRDAYGEALLELGRRRPPQPENAAG